MQKEEIKKLLEKYREGTCSAEEKAFLESWYQHYAKNKQVVFPDEEIIEKDLDDVWVALPANRQALKIRRLYQYISVAAAILLLFSVGIYIYINRNASQYQQEQAVKIAEMEIDNSHAYVLLDNGTKINLDSLSEGGYFEQGNTAFRKEDKDAVIYGSKEGINSGDVVFNTINIPKAKQYRLVLADGTKVWLNSLSAIRFPTAFNGSERRVEITGEAYFEVVRDVNKPFYVTAKGVTVKVLGTRFNVNAYVDEPVVKTALVSGAVEVSMPQHQTAEMNTSALLKPGEEAVTGKNGFNIQKVDTEEAIAWKNGLISFNNTDLEVIMRQVARWYDVEVEYKGEKPKRQFTGGISKQSPLSELLKVLELYEVKYLKEGNKIIVLPDEEK